jgi:hypothetical protein
MLKRDAKIFLKSRNKSNKVKDITCMIHENKYRKASNRGLGRCDGTHL